MSFIIADPFQDEQGLQVSQIMMLSRLMPECDQCGTKQFAAGLCTGANPLGQQPACSPIQGGNSLNSENNGLLNGEAPYPLRT